MYYEGMSFQNCGASENRVIIPTAEMSWFPYIFETLFWTFSWCFTAWLRGDFEKLWICGGCNKFWWTIAARVIFLSIILPLGSRICVAF